MTALLRLSQPSLTLRVHAGETWGILGSNGSGKTTLLHTLAGLNGKKTVWLHDQPLTNLTPRVIARSIALLFQDFNDTFPQTVWDYCKAARYPYSSYFKNENMEDRQIIKQALQTMELLPYQHREITQLSGGEKRRLALACVLAQTPEIYLLDEPTNHLDMRHQMQVLDHFHKLTTTTPSTVVMSLHDINIAQQYCTHVLLLFQDGSTLLGRTADIITQANLEMLYQYPMRAINTESGVFWLVKSGRMSASS